MKPEQLIEYFDRISEAPDAVARLRRFILDLAVRGKLVEQDPNDEPAPELLKSISAITGHKAIIKFTQEDKSIFELPSNWAWSRVGLVTTKTGSGSTPRGGKSVYKSTGVPFLRSQNVHNDGLRLDDVAYIDQNTHARMQGTTVESGDLLLNITGGSIGRCCRISDSQIEANISQHVAIIRLAVADMRDFVHKVVLSPFFQSYVFDEQTGAGRGGLPKNRMDKIPVPIPPLAEQRRIVAKVDELMALCDQLEAAKNEREAQRDRLVAASLHRIGTVPAAADGAATEVHNATLIRGAASIHLDHLPRLTTRPEHIKLLRQTILDLAVRGRLVPQDPNDDPACNLLARKVSLPKGYKRRRKILKESSVDAPVSLFPPIPLSWEYSNVQSLYDLNAIIDYADGNHGSLYPRSNEFGDSGVFFVTAKDLINGHVIWGSCAKLNEERAGQLSKGWAQGGDVLLTHNATVGRVARVEENVGRFLLGTSVTFYRLNQKVISPAFYYYMLLSSMWQGQLEAIMAQTTRNQVSIQKQAFFRVVVPPISEQHRIVAKVDELMALCDQLETQLTTTQTDSRRLLEAVLHEALSPAHKEVA